jgi:hypothetical protein
LASLEGKHSRRSWNRIATSRSGKAALELTD